MGLNTLENIVFRLAMCQIIGIDTLPASLLWKVVKPQTVRFPGKSGLAVLWTIHPSELAFGSLRER